jgi:hypothetical protein
MMKNVMKDTRLLVVTIGGKSNVESLSCTIDRVSWPHDLKLQQAYIDKLKDAVAHLEMLLEKDRVKAKEGAALSSVSSPHLR